MRGITKGARGTEIGIRAGNHKRPDKCRAFPLKTAISREQTGLASNRRTDGKRPVGSFRKILFAVAWPRNGFESQNARNNKRGKGTRNQNPSRKPSATRQMPSISLEDLDLMRTDLIGFESQNKRETARGFVSQNHRSQSLGREMGSNRKMRGITEEAWGPEIGIRAGNLPKKNSERFP